MACILQERWKFSVAFYMNPKVSLFLVAQCLQMDEKKIWQNHLELVAPFSVENWDREVFLFKGPLLNLG